MTEIRAAKRMAGLVGILGFALGLPACQSSGNGYPFLTNRRPGSMYDVQRPTYGPDTGKPFYISGYAGTNYEPLFQRRRMLNAAPTAPGASGPTVTVDQGAWEPD